MERYMKTILHRYEIFSSYAISIDRKLCSRSFRNWFLFFRILFLAKFTFDIFTTSIVVKYVLSQKYS